MWRHQSNTNTNENGYYNFSVQEGAYYKLKFNNLSGYVFSPKDKGTGSNRDKYDSDADTTTGWTDSFKVCSNDMTRDAGMYALPASFGDRVWYDANKDGVQDDVPEEHGISGITVNLYTCEDEFMGSKITDDSGNYEFTGLEPGCYYVEFIIPEGSGYEFTTAQTLSFELSAGENNLDQDAGLYIPQDQSIPEFPTIALPVAAILGLAFVMQRRKE